MSEEIKAIPTRYKGYHFRSRLEARWAVFFDVLGLRWEYEPEGFDLPGGIKYLPDFRIPEMSLWIEIKSSLPLHPKEEQKCLAFLEVLDKCRIDEFQQFVVLAGQPYLNEYTVARGYQQGQAAKYILADGYERWTHCPLCGKFDLSHFHAQFGDDTEGVSCMNCDVVDRSRKDTETTWFHKGIVETKQRGFILSSPSLMSAYNAARSARFEHGESGAT